MVGKLTEILEEYDKRLQEMPFIPRASYRRRMLRQDGGSKRNFFSTFSAIMGLLCSFLRTWACFGVRCSATSVIEIRRGPQNLVFLKDLGGDVEGRLLESSVRRQPLTLAIGSSRVN